jgi:hypothetical protein
MESPQDNGTPQIRIGKEANLDFFQSLLVNNNDDNNEMMMNPTRHLQESSLPNDETLLLPEKISVKVTLQATQESTLVQEFKEIPGTLFITTERLVFVSSNNNNNSDFSIHAECLLLHAISQDGLYIQVQDVNEEKDGLELTITPTTTLQQQQQQQQVMFDALTKLVSLHPIMDNNDDDDDDDDKDDDIGFLNDNAVIAPPRTNATAAAAAREEMLQRLDEMLVVEVPLPSEYHPMMAVLVQGQFEDAHEPQEEQHDDMNTSNNNNDDDDEELLL